MRGATLVLVAVAGCGVVEGAQPCERVMPTCADGAPAEMFEDFSPDASSCAVGSAEGGTWYPFADATDVTNPISGAIVHVTQLDGDLGSAWVSVRGDRSAVGVSDCSSPLGKQMCANEGAVIPRETAWLRWTITGVSSDGATVVLSTSADASVWIDLVEVPDIGRILDLEAATGCPGPPTTHDEPPPCGTPHVQLSDAVYACGTAL